MIKQTKAERAMDRLIDQIYRERCSGMQISVMRIPALFRMARTAIQAGETRDQVGDRMVAFVEQEKL
jgi:hypothetical protein